MRPRRLPHSQPSPSPSPNLQTVGSPRPLLHAYLPQSHRRRRLQDLRPLGQAGREPEQGGAVWKHAQTRSQNGRRYAGGDVSDVINIGVATWRVNKRGGNTMRDEIERE